MEKYKNIICKYIKEDEYNKTFDIIEKYHNWQYRKSGEMYIEHLLRTAINFIEIFEKNITTENIITCLLHDIIEDTNIDEKEIIYNFWFNIFYKVKALSKPKMYNTKEERNIKYYNQIIKNQDKSILMIKIADRIDNLQTIDIFEDYKKEKKINETKYFLLSNDVKGICKTWYLNIKNEIEKFNN